VQYMGCLCTFFAFSSKLIDYVIGCALLLVLLRNMTAYSASYYKCKGHSVIVLINIIILVVRNTVNDCYKDLQLTRPKMLKHDRLTVSLTILECLLYQIILCKVSVQCCVCVWVCFCALAKR